jgi:hypothetical protein
MIKGKISVLDRNEVQFKNEEEKTTLMVVILDLGNYSTILNTLDKWNLEVGHQYDVTVEYSYNKFKIKNVIK